MSTPDRVTFLVVDDDAVSVMSIRRALAKLRLKNPIEVAVDGLEALQKLRGTNGHEATAKPYIVLLDLNMPRMSGLEFLAEVREDRELASSVIFVLTTSDAPTDIAKAYAHKIAGYIVKEDAYETVKAALGMLNCYIEIVALET